MKKALLLMLGGCYLQQMTAQDYTQGYKYDSTEVENLRLPDSKNGSVTSPSQYSHREWCPPAQSQIFETCVSWASTNALTIQKRKALKNKQFASFSAPFLAHYLHRTDRFNQPMSLVKGLIQLRKRGSITVQDNGFTHNPKLSPTLEDSIAALQHKIKGFDVLFDRYWHKRKDTPNLWLSPKQLVSYLKKELMKNPIIVGIEINQDLKKLKKSEIWDGFTPQPTEPNMGHAVCIIGFDDAKGAFEIMNSWGANWADKGLGWISYSAMEKHCLQAFILQL